MVILGNLKPEERVGKTYKRIKSPPNPNQLGNIIYFPSKEICLFKSKYSREYAKRSTHPPVGNWYDEGYWEEITTEIDLEVEYLEC